ncbi:guanitoxin biosynthesis MBL fold metallo-hydrolase GntH [Thalassoglobus neptunius]|uniref:guanitoxin biosynthesis MBL fold metallo-hydrolase GntH n=1 Tax=Thalassoglobus neptunius TaxID=1938619 RepID=UPI0018D20FBC|nr:guanitoxin biosynthesis MBL fold metallo-hydrolase GntH [Thalassoglobus neptunius]
MAAGSALPNAGAAETASSGGKKNPYGGGPGTGLSLPPYFQPTKYVKNNNFYYPGTEDLGPDEMRVSFVGSCPWPPRRDQAGTCIMVELGNGQNFFFDLGSGAMRNIVAMGIPPALINDIFITHLHVDHYADLPYMLPFTASSGRFKPLRVTGPSGRNPELGIGHAVKHMKEMMKWHLEEFDTLPIGDGYEVEVNEFNFREENGICYQKDGVTVRHWPRSHGKDGASAYRLDWEETGLSFVWTGDGRPDELTAKYAKGADVFVTEVQSDLGQLMQLKYGYPQDLYNFIIDTHHTPHYAAGYLFKEVNPRIGMVCHLEYEPSLVNEISAGIRTHWDGLFAYGAPDVVVTNVTKDAVWVRDAVLPELGTVSMPSKPEQIMEMFGKDGQLPKEIVIPEPRLPREEQQIPYLREMEIDPSKYTPEDVKRDLVLEREEIRINVEEMKQSRLR